MNLSDIQQLLTYTEWANDLAMEAAARLPDEGLHRDFGISHKSIFGTLVHMAGAEWIWLERWNGNLPTKAEAWSRWCIEACKNFTTLKSYWAELVNKRAQCVSQLDESKLAAELSFKLLSGDPSSMPLITQIQHVVNHPT